MGCTGQEGVAVLIAAKDAAETIGRAVQSALADSSVTQVIVIDDGSADDTEGAAKACDDASGRLLVERRPVNAGPSAARNHAIALSTAPVVCVLDADDFFLPDRVRSILAQAGEDWDFASDGMLMVKEGEPMDTARRHDFRAMAGGGTLEAETFIEGNISRPGRLRLELGFMKPLMRRSFLDRHGLRYDETMRLGEDYALYTEALLRGARYRLTSGCGYAATWRSGSLSGRHGAGDLLALAAADDRLAALRLGAEKALRDHAGSVRRKAHFRQALDFKRQRAWPNLVLFLIRQPASIPYMVAETFRARFR